MIRAAQLCSLFLLSLVAASVQAQLGQNEHYGDSSGGYFGDPSKGHHGLPMAEPEEPPRAYRIARYSESPYLLRDPEQVIEFDPELYKAE